ncbi:hypothetical protein V8F20_003798 [Naviculisporaceae sp. PSN 640]
MFPTFTKSSRALVGLFALLVGSANAAHPEFAQRSLVFPGLSFLGSNLVKFTQRTANISTWKSGFLPKQCFDEAKVKGFSPADMEAFSITYDDCGEPWVFCRHVKSQTGKMAMVKQFGRLPVGMRDFVRHVISFPSSRPAPYAFALTGPGDIVMFGDASNDLTIWAHETAHCMDQHSGARPLGDFHRTETWIDAFSADTGVPDEYAKTNQIENFAQNVVVAMYDKTNNAKGGIWEAPGGCYKVHRIRHQLQTVLDYMGHRFEQTGQCARGQVLTSSPIININEQQGIKRRGIEKRTVLSLANVQTAETEFVDVTVPREDENVREGFTKNQVSTCLGAH